MVYRLFERCRYIPVHIEILVYYFIPKLRYTENTKYQHMFFYKKYRNTKIYQIFWYFDIYQNIENCLCVYRYRIESIRYGIIIYRKFWHTEKIDIFNIFGSTCAVHQNFRYYFHPYIRPCNAIIEPKLPSINSSSKEVGIDQTFQRFLVLEYKIFFYCEYKELFMLYIRSVTLLCLGSISD